MGKISTKKLFFTVEKGDVHESSVPFIVLFQGSHAERKNQNFGYL